MEGTTGAVRLAQLICVLERASGYAMKKSPKTVLLTETYAGRTAFMKKTSEIHIVRTG
ncbi:hypothetical protein OBV_10450 [Oscillibacter valericigenes Sjm18-20]|nr:hypothetical protein OBV_10450 [Oscillibacter valericigenes Sjm18-20]